MSGVTNRLLAAAAKHYQRLINSRVAAYGLKYQDLVVETPEVQKALSRLPEDTLVARDRRFKRALDISFKRKPLPAEYQEKIDVFDLYLEETLNRVQFEKYERMLRK